MHELVAIDLPGGPEFVVAMQRAWDAGDAVVPVDQRLADRAKADLLAELRPAQVVDSSGRAAVEGGRPVEAGDALVMATSGTTGVAKGVVLTHAAVAASADATTARLGVDPSRHRWLACLPLSHVGGLAVVTRSLLTGTPVEVLAGFDLDAVVGASGPDVLVSLVPTTLARVGAAIWHTVVLGGAAPPPGLAANVVTTYGMTETGSGVVYDGRPLDGVEISVDPLTAEIRLRGPMLLRAYRSAAGDRPALDEGGWLSTGDAGHWQPPAALADSGPGGATLVVDGRLSELIITGGDNVWPAPVEEALRAHPGVSDVAVAGRPDPEWGQRVVAWVVPDPAAPPTLEALRSVVRDRIAGYAAPRQLVLVDHIPRTSIGKVERHRLP